MAFTLGPGTDCLAEDDGAVALAQPHLALAQQVDRDRGELHRQVLDARLADQLAQRVHEPVAAEQRRLAEAMEEKGALTTRFNWDFVTQPDASDNRAEAAGLGVAILGSLYMMLVVLVLSVPIGVVAAKNTSASVGFMPARRGLADVVQQRGQAQDEVGPGHVAALEVDRLLEDGERVLVDVLVVVVLVDLQPQRGDLGQHVLRQPGVDEQPQTGAGRVGQEELDELVPHPLGGHDLDRRGALEGWEATAQQRFERLLRETGVLAGVIIGARETGRSAREGDEHDAIEPVLRLVVAPRGEASGHITWPLTPLATTAGRGMLAGLKLLLDAHALFTGPPSHRLPSILAESRAAQADVSSRLSGQVLASLHELLRGLDAAAPQRIRALAAHRPQHLYEGVLTVLLRLIFILVGAAVGAIFATLTELILIRPLYERHIEQVLVTVGLSFAAAALSLVRAGQRLPVPRGKCP